MACNLIMGGPDAYPELVKGLMVEGCSTECCLEGPLAQDKSYIKDGILMMVCPKCHLAWRTFEGVNGLRCIWYAPPQMLVSIFGEESLTKKEKEEYFGIYEDLRLEPIRFEIAPYSQLVKVINK